MGGLPCRYMVVLSQGGFYADLDTDCWKPLDSIMRPEDKMLVGWEDEFSSFEAKERHFFGRQRQVGLFSLLASQNQLPPPEPLRNMCRLPWAEASMLLPCAAPDIKLALDVPCLVTLLWQAHHVMRAADTVHRSACLSEDTVLQVLQWLFGAVAGHPVLRDVCDRIANTSGQSFSKDTNADTEERTGPGVWTDVVLQLARAHPPKVWQRQL